MYKGKGRYMYHSGGRGVISLRAIIISMWDIYKLECSFEPRFFAQCIYIYSGAVFHSVKCYCGNVSCFHGG